MQGASKALFKDWGVELVKGCLRFRVVHSQKDAVRVEELLNSRALAQKLRVGCNLEAGLTIQSIDGEEVLQLLTGSNRHGASLDDEL